MLGILFNNFINSGRAAVDKGKAKMKKNIEIIYYKGEDVITESFETDSRIKLSLEGECLFVREEVNDKNIEDYFEDRILYIIPLKNLIIFERKNVG